MKIFSAVKTENFIVIILKIFFSQNIDCGYYGGSNEYSQSMFWNKNKKHRYTPVDPSFAVGL